MLIRVLVMLTVAIVLGAAALLGIRLPTAGNAGAGTYPSAPSCEVDKVVTGDTFTCLEGQTVRMLQMDAPDPGDCGSIIARVALAEIFLPLGKRVRLEYDANRNDASGRTLAAPIVVGTDGNDYNISIVMVYVGLARAADVGGNTRYFAWAQAAETWARNAKWNMWAPGGAYNGAANCNEPL